MKIKNLFSKLLGNRIAKNAGWIIGGKIIHIILSLFVSLLTARYLGPSNYGLINYAGAYTTFFFSLCTLGINSILVKELVDEPDLEGTTLGTTLILRFISSTFSLLTIIGISMIVDRGEPTTIWVVALCSMGLVFQIFDTFNYWFQYRLQSKFCALATTIGYIIVSGYKLLMLALDMSVEWFAVSSSVDYAIVAACLGIAYKKKGGKKLRFSWKKAKELLGNGYHFILSGLMVAVYGATDRLMLKHILGEIEVGYYSTALAVCNLWVFLLSAIIDSMKPVILQQHKTDKNNYLRMNRQLYAIVFYISVVVSLVFVILGDFIIKLLYGKAYLPAAAPLKVITWYTAFSYLGVAREAWVVSENKQKYLKFLYAGAAVLNVILNAVFIPVWGASGAAAASLITQISTIFIFPVLIKDLRPNAKLMMESILLRKLK